jgi:hypothetical protein
MSYEIVETPGCRAGRRGQDEVENEHKEPVGVGSALSAACCSGGWSSEATSYQRQETGGWGTLPLAPWNLHPGGREIWHLVSGRVGGGWDT